MRHHTSSFSSFSALFATTALAFVALPGADLVAQNKTAIIPKKYAAAGSARTLVPFSEQPMRYQQTLTGKVMAEQIASPVRLRGISFRTKNANDAGVQIEVQIVISSYGGRVLNGIFDRNLGADAAIVVPKTKINLPTSRGGWADLQLPFSQDWIWDGKSDVILDIRIYSNGNQNRQFFYWWDSIAPDFAAGVNAQYALGANSSTARVPLTNQGLVVRFDYQEGLVLNYGAGCKGQGGFVPKISTLGLPTVGNTGFRINVSNARPNTGAILMWGVSDTAWGPIKLPFALVNIGIPNCTLLAEPLDIIGTGTVGGSPGSGIGSVAFPIPASAIFLGLNLYMQWGVVDDTNNAALDLVFSDAARVIIG